MPASRWTSSGVNPRCRPLRRPSAAPTVELLRHPISSPSLDWAKEELAGEGRLIVLHGRGTFVAHPAQGGTG